MTTRTILIINLVLTSVLFGSLFKLLSPSAHGQLIRYQPDAQQAALKAQEIRQTCTQSRTTDCYQKQLVALVNERDFFFAEATLFALQDLDPATRSCHVIAHFMSREPTKKNLKHWKKFLDQVDVNACGSGFLHGVLETYSSYHPSFKLNADFIQEACSSPDSYRERMCSHFMGHVALLETEGKFDQALALCGLARPELIFDCYDGLFMEKHQKLALAEHGIEPLPIISVDYLETLRQDCLKYEGDQAQACWVEMAEMYAKLYNYDAGKIYIACSKAPRKDYSESCYNKAIVATATFPLPNYDHPDRLKSICHPYLSKKTDYQKCTRTIFSALFYYSPKFVSRGITLCSSLSVNEQSWCFTNLGTQFKQAFPSLETRTALCASAPNQYQALCAVK